MTEFVKRLLSIILISGLCLHFFLISIYSSPYKIKSSQLKFASWLYVYPYFHQGWALFTPIPKKKMALYVREKSNNHWSNWENLLQKRINKHKTNVFIGNELSTLIYCNSLIYFLNSQKNGEHLFMNEIADINFQILKHEVKSEITNYGKVQNITEFEMITTCIEESSYKAFYAKNLY